MSKVLLIDDDVELVGMFQEYLTQEGFDAKAVHDGERGAAEALTGLYAIAVLDVMMPRRNGGKPCAPGPGPWPKPGGGPGMARGGGPSGADSCWASASSGMLQADSSNSDRTILRCFIGLSFRGDQP